MKKYCMALMLALCVVGGASAAEKSAEKVGSDMTRQEYGERLLVLSNENKGAKGWIFALAYQMNNRLIREGEEAAPPQFDLSLKND